MDRLSLRIVTSPAETAPHRAPTPDTGGDLPGPPLNLGRRDTALFFDFDGTLAPIVPNPHEVALPPRTAELLGRLSAQASGAVAVVSGRPVSELDLLLAPLVLPLAGVHGRQRRDGAGLYTDTATDLAAVDGAEKPLAAFSACNAGTLVERKPGAVALHYRQRPELAGTVVELARAIAREEAGLRLIEGKMVVEFCVGRIGKGDAVAAFLAETPFIGRRPIYFGDDVTDEDAYPVVDAAGGISVRIGPGATRARHRLPDVAALQGWLGSLTDRWSEAR